MKKMEREELSKFAGALFRASVIVWSLSLAVWSFCLEFYRYQKPAENIRWSVTLCIVLAETKRTRFSLKPKSRLSRFELFEKQAQKFPLFRPFSSPNLIFRSFHSHLDVFRESLVELSSWNSKSLWQEVPNWLLTSKSEICPSIFIQPPLFNY